MKKLLAIVLTIAMVMSVVVLPTAVMATAENAIGNVAFEGFEGSSHWIPAVDGDHPTSEITTEYARTGTKSWHVGYNGSQSWKNSFSYIGNVEEGKTYIIDYYVKFGDDYEKLGGKFAFGYAVTGSKGTTWPISYSGTIFSAADWYLSSVKDPEWHHVSYKITATGDGALYANIGVQGAIHSDFYVDDMSLTEVTDAMSVLTVTNARPMAQGDASTAIYLAGVKGSKVEAFETGVAEYIFGGLYTDNTLATPITVFPNSDADAYCYLDYIQTFENFTGAVNANGQTLEVVNSGKSGKGFSFSGTGFGWSLYAFNVGINVEANSEYLVEFDYQITSKPSDSFRIYPVIASSTNIWSGNGIAATVNENQCALTAWQDPDGNWEHASLSFSTGANNTNKALWLNMRATASGKTIGITFDNIIVRKVTTGRKIVITNNAYNGNKWNNSAVRMMMNIGDIDYVPSHAGYLFNGWFTDSGLTTPVTAITAGTDTIYAGWLQAEDFEGSPTIVATKDGVAAVSSEEAHGGTHSLKVDATKSDWGTLAGVRDVKTVSASTTYKVTFKYKITQAFNRSDVIIYPIVANSSNMWQQLTPLPATYNFIIPQAVTDGWVDGVFAFTTPSSLTNTNSVACNSLMLAIQNPNASGTATSGIIYIDDIVVTALSGESVVSYNANGGPALTRTWEFVSNGSAVPYTPTSFVAFTGWYSDAECTSPVTTVTTSGTLYAGWSRLSNSFEAGYSSAQTDKKFTINTDPAYVHSGSQSIHYSGAVKWENFCASVGTITPGKTYVVDFWYYLTAAPTAPITFQGLTYPGDNAWPIGTNLIQVSTTNELFKGENANGTVYPIRDWYTECVGSWKHAYFVMQTDSTSSYTTFGINFIAAAAGTADIYIDDVTLTEVGDDEKALVISDSYATNYRHSIPVIVSVGDDISSALVSNFGTYAPSTKCFDKFVDEGENEVSVVTADLDRVWAIWQTAVATNGSQGFATLAESLAEASGEVSLMGDAVGESNITVNASTTLDLSGNSITGAAGFIANGSIKDTADPAEKAVISATNIVFGDRTDYFPIYNNNTTGKGSGYSLYKAGMNSMNSTDTLETEGYGRIIFALKTGAKWNNERYAAFDLLTGGNEVSKVKAVVEVHYTSGGNPQTATYTYSDEDMSNYCDKTVNKAFSLTYSGVESMEGRVTAITKFVVYDSNDYVIGTFGATEQVLKES